MIVGRGGGVVMLYVFLFFLACALFFRASFVYLTSCANYRMNFLGGFF